MSLSAWCKKWKSKSDPYALSLVAVGGGGD